MNDGGDDEERIRYKAKLELAKQVSTLAHAVMAGVMGEWFLNLFYLTRFVCFVGLLAMVWMFVWRGFMGSFMDLAVITLGATWLIGNIYGIAMTARHVVTHIRHAVESGETEGVDVAVGSLVIVLTKVSQVFFLGLFAASVLVVASLLR